MSTRVIREALEMASARRQFGDHPDEAGAYAAALEAVAAIEGLARSIVDGGGAEVLRENHYDTSVDMLERIAKEAP